MDESQTEIVQEKRVGKITEGQLKEYQSVIRESWDYAERVIYPRADRMVNYYHINPEYAKSWWSGGIDQSVVPRAYSDIKTLISRAFPATITPKVRLESFVRQKTEEIERQFETAETYGKLIKVAQDKGNLKEKMKEAAMYSFICGASVIRMNPQKSSKYPLFKAYSHREFFLDYSRITDANDASICGFLVTRPLQDIKNDKRFNTSARNQVSAVKMEDGKKGTFAVQAEIFDRREGKYFIAEWDGSCITDNVLFETNILDVFSLKSADDRFLSHWPLSILVDDPMVGIPWGMGELFPIESLMRETDYMRTLQMKSYSGALPKVAVTKGTLDANAKEALASDIPNAVIEFEVGSALDSARPFQSASFGSDFHNAMAAIREDIQLTHSLGPDSVGRGLGERQPQTLGQAQIINQNSMSRIGDKTDMILGSFKEVYHLIAAYIAQEWSGKDEAIRVGQTGDPLKDFAVIPDAIDPEQYSFDIEPTSTDVEERYREQFAQAVQVVAPLIPYAEQSASLAVLLRSYLSSFGSIDQRVEEIIPSAWTKVLPNGMTREQEMQAQEIAKLPPEQQEMALAELEKMSAQGGQLQP